VIVRWYVKKVRAGHLFRPRNGIQQGGSAILRGKCFMDLTDDGALHTTMVHPVYCKFSG